MGGAAQSPPYFHPQSRPLYLLEVATSPLLTLFFLLVSWQSRLWSLRHGDSADRPYPSIGVGRAQPRRRIIHKT
jgi:hypothetical protein